MLFSSLVWAEPNTRDDEWFLRMYVCSVQYSWDWNGRNAMKLIYFNSMIILMDAEPGAGGNFKATAHPPLCNAVAIRITSRSFT